MFHFLTSQTVNVLSDGGEQVEVDFDTFLAVTDAGF